MAVSLFTVAGQNNLDKGSEINDLSKGDNLKTIPVKVEKTEVQPKNMEKKEEVKKAAPSPVKGDNITEKKEVKEVDLTVEFAKMSMNGGVNGGLVDRQDKLSDTEKELNTMTSNLSISDDSVKLNGEVKSRGPVEELPGYLTPSSTPTSLSTTLPAAQLMMGLKDPENAQWTMMSIHIKSTGNLCLIFSLLILA